MCQQLIVLAEENASRYVSRCEHRVVHLTWDCLTLHFREDGFERFGRWLQRLKQKFEADHQDQLETERQPAQKTPAEYEIRVGAIRLIFSAADLWTITDLVTTALEQPGDVPANCVDLRCEHGETLFPVSALRSPN